MQHLTYLFQTVSLYWRDLVSFLLCAWASFSFADEQLDVAGDDDADCSVLFGVRSVSDSLFAVGHPSIMKSKFPFVSAFLI